MHLSILAINVQGNLYKTGSYVRRRSVLGRSNEYEWHMFLHFCEETDYLKMAEMPFLQIELKIVKSY